MNKNLVICRPEFSVCFQQRVAIRRGLLSDDAVVPKGAESERVGSPPPAPPPTMDPTNPPPPVVVAPERRNEPSSFEKRGLLFCPPFVMPHTSTSFVMPARRLGVGERTPMCQGRVSWTAHLVPAFLQAQDLFGHTSSLILVFSFYAPFRALEPGLERDGEEYYRSQRLLS